MAFGLPKAHLPLWHEVVSRVGRNPDPCTTARPCAMAVRDNVTQEFVF